MDQPTFRFWIVTMTVRLQHVTMTMRLEEVTMTMRLQEVTMTMEPRDQKEGSNEELLKLVEEFAQKQETIK